MQTLFHRLMLILVHISKMFNLIFMYGIQKFPMYMMFLNNIKALKEQKKRLNTESTQDI